MFRGIPRAILLFLHELPWASTLWLGIWVEPDHSVLRRLFPSRHVTLCPAVSYYVFIAISTSGWPRWTFTSDSIILRASAWSPHMSFSISYISLRQEVWMCGHSRITLNISYVGWRMTNDCLLSEIMHIVTESISCFLSSQWFPASFPRWPQHRCPS